LIFTLIKEIILTVFISRCPSTHVHAHLIKRTEILGKGLVPFLVQPSKTTELFPLKLYSLAVSLNAKRRDNTIEVGLFSSRPMTAKNNKCFIV
jgi:hypothetical protein